jgi:hypothetical protein
MMLRQGLGVAVLSASLAAGSWPAIPHAAWADPGIVQIEVDTFDPVNNPIPHTTTPFTLVSGVEYRVTVQGTYSRWSKASWESAFHTTCGTPEPLPMYLSPGTENHVVGLDAETAWADTRQTSVGPSCDAVTPADRRGGLLLVNLNGTDPRVHGNYFDPTPVTGQVGAPSSDHRYTYSFTGRGQPATFGVSDITTKDNYGRLVVRVERTGDSTAPSVVPVLDPPANARGWHRTTPTVGWNVSDPETRIVSRSGCDATTIVDETAGRTLTCTATNVAGLVGSGTTTVQLDSTPPTVTWTPGAPSYDVDETVRLHCEATDTLSGVSTSTCADVVAPAYTLLGATTYVAVASDVAGNDGSGSVTVRVVPTSEGLCRLTRNFSASGGIATALCVHLRSAQAASRAATAEHQRDQYRRLVRAQTGRAFTAPQAAVLVRASSRL